MGELEFDDGVKVNTDGPFRIIRLPDGLYVTGHGFLVPVDSYDEGNQLIKELELTVDQENTPGKE